jgi:hypothetical protein
LAFCFDTKRVSLLQNLAALTTTPLIRYEWYSRLIKPVGTVWHRRRCMAEEPVKARVTGRASGLAPLARDDLEDLNAHSIQRGH